MLLHKGQLEPLLGHRPHGSCAAAARSILSHKPAFFNSSFLSCSSLLAGSTPIAELQQNHTCSYHKHTIHLPTELKTREIGKKTTVIKPNQPNPAFGKPKTPVGVASTAPLWWRCCFPRGFEPLQTLPWGWGTLGPPHTGRDLLSIMGLKQLKAVGLNISLLLGK